MISQRGLAWDSVRRAPRRTVFTLLAITISVGLLTGTAEALGAAGSVVGRAMTLDAGETPTLEVAVVFIRERPLDRFHHAAFCKQPDRCNCKGHVQNGRKTEG